MSTDSSKGSSTPVAAGNFLAFALVDRLRWSPISVSGGPARSPVSVSGGPARSPISVSGGPTGSPLADSNSFNRSLAFAYV